MNIGYLCGLLLVSIVYGQHFHTSHCYDAYYECSEQNPCYEKEVCFKGCCVNATCPGPEFYCFSNGEYQCYEDEHCGKETGCCEKNPITTTPYPYMDPVATTQPPYMNPAHNAGHSRQQNMGNRAHHNMGTGQHHNVGSGQQHNMGQNHHQQNSPPHKTGQGGTHGQAPPQNFYYTTPPSLYYTTAPQNADYRNCDPYYHCTTTADCWEPETCHKGCCVTAP
ncbi:uncharacterized protein LOC133185810 [Saccostrea echinata]|uniref:uncharacterized protein LOC133185810 n=1 Tax=Saccostrea echinata TaxID=191078 RepID=UPI002A83A7FF|nr:uncharacterized protein LOC133185810 [Saccostrea echinata]